MDIERRIRTARNLTPTEQHLAHAVLALGERVQLCTIKELAAQTATSISSIHRLCRKLDLDGFKGLKVELARAAAARAAAPVPDVDINFPFQAGDTARDISARIAQLYEATLRGTRDVLSPDEVDRVAERIERAAQVDIYTQSHNLYPANMFCDRLMSVGKQATCHENIERQSRTALAATDEHLAIFISYSGHATNIAPLLPVLAERSCPAVLVGTAYAARLHPGLDAYLLVDDRESLQNRITQFASHTAVQYVLDTLFSCYFARTYEQSIAFLERSLPFGHLPGIPEDAARAHLSPDDASREDTALGLVQLLR